MVLLVPVDDEIVNLKSLIVNRNGNPWLETIQNSIHRAYRNGRFWQRLALIGMVWGIKKATGHYCVSRGRIWRLDKIPGLAHLEFSEQ
jgi:hypothetical protein